MTMFTLRRLAGIGTALAVLGTAPAFAQATKPAAGAAQPQQISRAQLSQQLDSEYKQLDANGDGKLTKAEIEAALGRRVAEATTQLRAEQKADFDKLDANHDGQLSFTEFQATASVNPPAGLADARLKQLDTNHDGAISATEYRNGTLTQFDAVDTNHDGVVSAAEAQATQGR